ncbi:MAG: ABC transporter substrate-binding protein [Microbacterium enclense]
MSLARFLRPTRVVAAAATVAVSAALLSGCATGPADAAATPASSAGGFPVTIDDAYGEATIAAAPERVVTLGWMEADIVTALGVEPVATSAFPFDTSGIAPWLAPELTTTPELIQTAAAGADRAPLDLEAIAALQPDLIVATSYVDLEANYAALSAIAPVVGPSAKNIHHLDWQVEAPLIAEALGKTEAVQPLVDADTTTFSEAGTSHPELKGLTYTLSLATPNALKVVNDPEDGSVRAFDALGMTFSPTAAALPSLDDGSGAAGLSFETVDQADADRVYIAFLSADVKTAWQNSAVYPTLTAVKDGHVVDLTMVQIAALRNPSPLNASYALSAIAGS